MNNSNNNSMYYRYFMYSAEEEDMKIKLNPNSEFGIISVRGVPKKYTSIVTDPNNSRADAIVIWKGDIRKANYTYPNKK